MANEAACGCTYKNSVGAVECSKPVAALNQCGIYFCLEDMDTYTKNACDPADPDSGKVVDLVLNESANTFTVREESEDFNSAETVNDGGNNEINEVLNGQVNLDAPTLCWMRENLGRDMVHIREGKNGDLYAFGLGGGLKLNDFDFQSGKTGTDFQGGNYNLINTSGPGFCIIDPVAAGFPNNAAFLNSLL